VARLLLPGSHGQSASSGGLLRQAIARRQGGESPLRQNGISLYVEMPKKPQPIGTFKNGNEIIPAATKSDTFLKFKLSFFNFIFDILVGYVLATDCNLHLNFTRKCYL